MPFEVGQIVHVSTYNRLRGAKPYCKQHKIMRITNGRISTCPVPGGEYPSLWLHFGINTLTCIRKVSKYEYRIFRTVEAFNRAVLEGEFENQN